MNPASVKIPLSHPWLVAVAITVAALFLVVARNDLRSRPIELPSLIPDNSTYLLMAQGHTDEAMAPFTRRALFPFIAREVSLASGLPLRTTFVLLDIGAFLLLVYFLAKIFRLFGLCPWIASVFVLTPVSLDWLENGYMPDLLHSALIAAFFLLLLRDKYPWALAVLVIAYMTRENTLILCLVLGLMAWLRRRRVVAIGSAAVILIGTAFGSWCIRLGQPNASHLPDFLYLMLKVPHQFLKNILGLRIWTNTLPFGDPIHIYPLPSFLRAGDVREIALCYPEWTPPCLTLISLLTLFGAGPLIVWMTRHLRLWADPHPFAIQVAFVYGAFAFFLGTSVGDGVERLIGYGWPLFWIAVPYLLGLMKRRQQHTLLTNSLLAVGLIAWLPEAMDYSRWITFPVAALTLIASLLAYRISWQALRRECVELDPAHAVIDTRA